MDCTKFRELISLYIDEQTSMVQAQAIEKHVESCGSCKSELASQIKLKEMIGSSFETSVNIDLSASIMQKINQPTIQEVKKPSKMKKISLFVAAAAAVCVLAMAAMMSLHVDNDVIAGNEKLEEYVIEHVGGAASDFNGKVEAVNLER